VGLIDVMGALLGRTAGLEDVTEMIDPRLVRACSRSFGEDFDNVRFLQIIAWSPADLVARLWAPKALALAWANNVIFPPGRESIYAAVGAARDERRAGTIAHELWHVRQFRALGTVGWLRSYLREWVRLGHARMGESWHEHEAREAAASFVRSDAWRDLR